MAERRATEVVAALLLGAVLGTGAHLVAVGASPAQGSVPPGQAGAQVLGRVEVGWPDGSSGPAGVLRVASEGCGARRTASATLVAAPDGPRLVTNAHVVAGDATVELATPDGAVRSVEVLGVMAERDLALLDVPADLEEAPVLVPGAAVSQGDPVEVAGHPDGRARRSAGRVVATELRSSHGGTSEVIVTDVPVRGGSSGGAVLAADGRVVGIVAARDPRDGGAVAYPVSEVLAGSPVPAVGC